MKALLKLEAIGYNVWQQNRGLPKFMGSLPRRWWVARITGYDERYGYKRDFLRGQVNFTNTNSNLSRGVYIEYFLDPGLYEVNEPVSWKNDIRYFARSTSGKIEKISKTELNRSIGVDTWLKLDT